MTTSPIRSETDDAIRNFRRVFLGANGSTLPWEASYKAYGVFALFALVDLVLVLGVLGWPLLSMRVIYSLAVCAGLTRLVMKRTDAETPLRALPSVVVATAKAGRLDNHTHITKFDTSHLRVTDDPWEPSTQSRRSA